MKKIINFSIILIFILFCFITIYKYERFENFFRYFIYDETYVNRTFYLKKNVVFSKDEKFDAIRFDKKLDDSRGHYPNFNIPISEQLTIPTSKIGLVSYKEFINQYLSIVKSYKQNYQIMPDKFVFEIMTLVNASYKNNLNKKRKNIGRFFLSEKNYRSEDFIYFVVNERTGCGETGEAMVSLLRGAGYKARLLRYSIKHKPIMANHIFAEFYSNEKKRWIMLEPMINYSPKINNFNISGMEMINSKESLLNINKIWEKAEGHKKFYNRNGLIWFNKKGIITNFYYTSGSNDTLKYLELAFNKKN